MFWLRKYRNDTYLTSDVVKELNKLIREVDNSINNINRGGCGFFAHSLGARLEKVGYRVNYKVIGYRRTSRRYFKSNRKKLNNTQGDFDYGTLFNGIRWFHIMLYVDGYYIDSSGVTYHGVFNILRKSKVNKSDYGYDIGGITRQELSYMLDKLSGMWNCEFNQDDSLKMDALIKFKFQNLFEQQNVEKDV